MLCLQNSKTLFILRVVPREPSNLFWRMWGVPNPPYRKKSAKKFLKGFLTLTISPIVTIHTNTTATVQLTNPNDVAGLNTWKPVRTMTIILTPPLPHNPANGLWPKSKSYKFMHNLPTTPVANTYPPFHQGIKSPQEAHTWRKFQLSCQKYFLQFDWEEAPRKRCNCCHSLLSPIRHIAVVFLLPRCWICFEGTIVIMMSGNCWG